jgi:AcrR family transcriptional regulator
VITDAALAIVRHAGVDGLTMRALADALGVDVAATYRHVRDKQALLALVLDQALEKVEVSEDDAVPPLDRVADLTRATFRQILDHPGLGSIVMRVGGHTTQTRRLRKITLQLLMEAGFDEATAKKVEEARNRLWLGSVVVASAAGRAGGPNASRQRHRALAQLDFAIELLDKGMRAALQQDKG